MTQGTAHIPLDERGLEAATYAICILLERGHATEADLARYGVHAYLQTAAADVSGLVDVSDLVAKLRAGDQMNGRTVNCKLDACNCSVMDEAASTIQTLSASNAALEAEIKRLRGDMQRIIDAPLIDHTDPNNNPAAIARAALSALPSSPAEGEKL